MTMSPPGRERQRQAAPGWVTEGTAITDPLEDRKGIVQFVGEWGTPPPAW
ncbi:hypothetical protein ABZ924_28465 [Streptomyces sp. NPDC046876]